MVLTGCLYCIAIYSRIVSIVVLVLCVSNVVEVCWQGFLVGFALPSTGQACLLERVFWLDSHTPQPALGF